MENQIGQRIRKRRKELNITQSKIQNETSISSGNLSCIENGKYLPSATALLELSQILECSIDWILTGESNINNVEILDIKEKEFLIEFRELSVDDQDELLALLHMKYQRLQKKRMADPKSSISTGLNVG